MSASLRRLVGPLTAVAVAAGTSFAVAQTGAPVVIRAHFQETHSRLDGEYPPIIWDRDVTISLSGRNNVHEDWAAHNSFNLQRSPSGDRNLGDSLGNVVWHVSGGNRLERTAQFVQHTMTMAISIRGDHSCDLRVTYRQKPGFHDMFVPRADTGEMAHFTLPKVLSQSCSVE